MACIVYVHSLFLFMSIFSIYLNVSAREASNDGFRIDLIHRDSPASPFYNPYETPMQRLKNGFQRFISSVNRFNTTSLHQSTAQSQLIPETNGEYIMKLSIGTPPVDVYAIVDTGSDLMWTQCQPCNTCYKQVNPIFNPGTSSSYDDISCQSQQCHLLDIVSCSSQNQNICSYSYGYGDGSLTQGVLAKETITFSSTTGQPVSLENIVFGCGHNNSGVFTEQEMGLVGLGGGPISLISQIGSSFGDKKFSQCLMPLQTNSNISGKMIFGTGSDLVGAGVVSTPLVPKQDKTYYYVTLQGISVGDEFLPYNSSQMISKGNIFIDSGTPPTILPQNLYNRLEEKVKNKIQLVPVKDPNSDPQLCYKSNTNIEAPILIAHFEGGADVQLMPINTFIQAKEGVFCFAMSPTTNDIGVFGNYAQMNFLLGFDLDKNMVSFKPADCSKQ